MRAVARNVDMRGAFKNTRMNTLYVLAKISEGGTISQIDNKAKRLGHDLNYQRVRVGLTTWQKLGIVEEDADGKFYISSSFEKIVEGELRRKGPSL